MTVLTSVLFSVVFGVIALVSYGLADYFGPLASRKVGAFEASAIQRIIATVILLLIFLVFFPVLPTITSYDWGLILATGAIMLVGVVAYNRGAKVGNISTLSAIGNSFSIITVALIFVFLNPAITTIELLSIAAIIIGTVLASFRLEDLRTLNLKFSNRAIGVEYGLLAMFGWGVGFFLSILLVRQLGWFLPALLVSAVLVVYFAFLFKPFGLKYVDPRPVWKLFLLTGVLAVTGIFGYNLGVATGNSVIVAPIAAASPIVTAILAVVRQKERLEINHKAGIAMIILGLIALSV
jgi:drug/metabolite transporter (DMT)-like permease